jgi:hypothetical protein
MQYKSKAESMGIPTAYGATTKTTAPLYVKHTSTTTGAVDLKIPEEFKISEANEYWVKMADGSMEKFANKRQFNKIFKEREKELNLFIDHNDISFKKTAEVAKLINYYNQLK